MNKVLDNFNSKFKVSELEIYETEFWIWSLRPVQVTLGSGILSLKRECQANSKLTEHEFTDMSNIIKKIEEVMGKTFNYSVMNYLMLMMDDKQVHYHVIPRYKYPVNFFGTKWRDSDWPGIANLKGEEADKELLYKLQKHIRHNI